MADIFLGDDDDIEVGTQGADSIRGGGGDDDLNGLGGGDGIDGGDGDDRLRGGSGNDTIVGGGTGADLIEGGSGDDSLDGANNDDTLIGGTGADRLVGGTGADLLRGGDDDDTLEGGGDDDELFGGGEDDRLTGGTGADTVFGGPQDDVIVWRAGDGEDEIDGGSGEDTLQAFGFTTDRNLFSLEEEDGGRLVLELRERTPMPPFPLDARLDELEGLEVVELFGGTDDDQISLGRLSAGSLEVIRISLGSGDDDVFGGGEPLTPDRNEVPLDVSGGQGEDFLTGSFVNDTLDGGFGDDRLDGEVGDDLLLGGAGDDELDGGFNGADTLDGGTGSDQLTGGARDNPDTFRFRFGPGQGVDDIQDFETDERIEIFGATQAQLDSDGNGILNNADAAVFGGFGILQIDGLFPLTGTLRVAGFGGADVDSLVIGDDVFFLV